MSGGNPRADLYVFNGSSATANIAVHILDKDGNNLAGVTIPGSSPAATYPGQTGASMEALLAGHTKIVTWPTPQDSPPGSPNVSATVRVISDQPIAVGSDFQFSGFKPLPCVFKIYEPIFTRVSESGWIASEFPSTHNGQLVEILDERIRCYLRPPTSTCRFA